jgi:hypothetical protein
MYGEHTKETPDISEVEGEEKKFYKEILLLYT